MARINPNKIINAINKAIALNPTEITFTQIALKEVDGAFESVTDERTITVLIYVGSSTNSVNVNINSEIKGSSYVSIYKMIADKDAGLDVKPTQSIKFTSNGDKFEIKAVYPIIISDMVCGYECDLDRID